MLDINLLSVISFANIFTHSAGCLRFINGFLCCAKPGFKENNIQIETLPFPRCVTLTVKMEIMGPNSWFIVKVK